MAIDSRASHRCDVPIIETRVLAGFLRVAKTAKKKPTPKGLTNSPLDIQANTQPEVNGVLGIWGFKLSSQVFGCPKGWFGFRKIRLTQLANGQPA